MDNKATLHIPVVGLMVRNADGTYRLDEEKSTWADIPADAVARFLIDKLGGEIPGVRGGAA